MDLQELQIKKYIDPKSEERHVTVSTTSVKMFLDKMLKDLPQHNQSVRASNSWLNCEGCKHSKGKWHDVSNSRRKFPPVYVQSFNSFPCRMCLSKYRKAESQIDDMYRENVRSSCQSIVDNPDIIDCKIIITKIKKKIKAIQNETSEH